MTVANSDEQAAEPSKTWQDSSGKALARRDEDSKDIIVDDLAATLEAHRASNRAAVVRKVASHIDSQLPFFQLLLRTEINEDESTLNDSSPVTSRPLLRPNTHEGGRRSPELLSASANEEAKRQTHTQEQRIQEEAKARRAERRKLGEQRKKDDFKAEQPGQSNQSEAKAQQWDQSKQNEAEARKPEQSKAPLQMWPADSLQARERYGKTGSRKLVKKTEPLEYTGMDIYPKGPWKINRASMSRSIQRPWLTYLETTSENYTERFVMESRQGCRS